MENNEALAKSRRWKSLWAAFLGWTLDAADWMMLALALPLIGNEFHLGLAQLGLLGTITLAGAAIGGICIGILADYLGRVRVMMYTMITYAVFTAACGFVQNFEQLLVLRFLVGIGLGGEWGVGAALVSEYWPSEYRARATCLVHSGWPVGYGLAAVAFMFAVPLWGWRSLFWLGIIPAFVAIWVRLSVPEPEAFQELQKRRAAADSKKEEAPKFPLATLFSGRFLRISLLGMIFSSFALMAYWGTATWLPSFLLKTRGLDIVKTGGYLIVLNVGAWFGYQFFGWLADKKGRRVSFLTGMFVSVIVTIIYVNMDSPRGLLMFGPVFGFVTYGYFGVFGAFVSELYPAEARATGTSLIFNFGRGVSMLSPYIIGAIASGFGFVIGLGVTAAFYLVGAVAIYLLPETSKCDSARSEAGIKL